MSSLCYYVPAICLGSPSVRSCPRPDSHQSHPPCSDRIYHSSPATMLVVVWAQTLTDRGYVQSPVGFHMILAALLATHASSDIITFVSLHGECDSAEERDVSYTFIRNPEVRRRIVMGSLWRWHSHIGAGADCCLLMIFWGTVDSGVMTTGWTTRCGSRLCLCCHEANVTMAMARCEYAISARGPV
jgi:hypothetical protein